MSHNDARDLLDRIGVFRRRCDVDLLVFFARHPNSLLASESLADFLGYSLQEIAVSLDVLMNAGFLRRTQTPAHAARLYVFAAGGPNGGWLAALLRFASTRPGRLALREALDGRGLAGTDDTGIPADARRTTARGGVVSSMKPRAGRGGRTG